MARPDTGEVEGPVEALLPAAGALLVRVPVNGPGWPGALPAVPRPHTLTASVGDPVLSQVPADDLVASGYRLVGVHLARLGGGSVVDVLVPARLQDELPGFVAELVARAARVFHLDLGPVMDILSDEIAMHVAALASGDLAGLPAEDR